MPELKATLGAVIFASKEPVKIKDLAEFLEVSPEQVKSVVTEMTAEFENPASGLRLVEVAGGIQMVTAPECGSLLREYFKIQKKIRLSRPALETLAVIAYNQPITRPEVDAVRGVNSDGVLKTLLEKRLVEISGRRDEPGKPLLYKTTDEFLMIFGLKNLKDMPDIRELEQLVETEVEDVDPGYDVTQETPETAAQPEPASPLPRGE